VDDGVEGNLEDLIVGLEDRTNIHSHGVNGEDELGFQFMEVEGLAQPNGEGMGELDERGLPGMVVFGAQMVVECTRRSMVSACMLP
jgi:hypothetical protein